MLEGFDNVSKPTIKADGIFIKTGIFNNGDQWVAQLGGNMTIIPYQGKIVVPNQNNIPLEEMADVLDIVLHDFGDVENSLKVAAWIYGCNFMDRLSPKDPFMYTWQGIQMYTDHDDEESPNREALFNMTLYNDEAFQNGAMQSAMSSLATMVANQKYVADQRMPGNNSNKENNKNDSSNIITDATPVTYGHMISIIMKAAVAGAWERISASDIPESPYIVDTWRCQKLSEGGEICNMMLNSKPDSEPLAFVRRGLISEGIEWEYEFNYGLLGTVQMQDELDNGFRVLGKHIVKTMGKPNNTIGEMAQITDELLESATRVKCIEQNSFAPLIRKISESTIKQLQYILSSRQNAKFLSALRVAYDKHGIESFPIFATFLQDNANIFDQKYFKTIYNSLGVTESYEHLIEKHSKCHRAYLELVYANSINYFFDLVEN